MSVTEWIEANVPDGRAWIAVRRGPPPRHGARYSFDRLGRVTDVDADRVVLALPFTRLRTVDLDEAGLSERKRRVIAVQPNGSNPKVHLAFAAARWSRR